MAEPNDQPNENDQQTNDQQTDDPLAHLDAETRRLVETANAEAAARRHDVARAREQLQERERELAELRREQESETERVVREAEERGATTATSALAPRLLEADLAIAAAGRLRDPQDAAGLIPRATLDALLSIEETGERRERAREAIDALLEAKPYLAAEQTNDRHGSGPLVTQGARSPGAPSRTAKTPDDWLRERKR